jgi:hypothetical protein
LRSALRQGLLSIDRFAVVSWVPSQEAKAILLGQSLARGRPSALSRPQVEPHTEDGSVPRGVAQHGDKALHRRTIRKVLNEATGAHAVSHIDGTIDVQVPPSSDAVVFREVVVDVVTRLGYRPAVAIIANGPSGAYVRVSTVETLAQQRRGAHREH